VTSEVFEAVGKLGCDDGRVFFSESKDPGRDEFFFEVRKDSKFVLFSHVGGYFIAL
jgi:hypothetical protein